MPATVFDCSLGHHARLQLAVEVLTLSSTGAASLALPVVAADGGDLCAFDGSTPPLNAAVLDKDWLSFDKTTRTLAMSYTRFFFGFGGQSGTGQIEMVRAHLPADPRTVVAANWSAPIVVWPEEPNTVNHGVYVTVAANGDAYLSWERNIESNTFNGNPYVFIHAARVRAGDVSPVVGGPALPRVVSLGQRNSNGAGGVKSLDLVVIAGYNRGTGQDFPRIAVDGPKSKVIIVWNDASAQQQMATHCASASVPYASTSNMCTADSTPMIGYRRCRGPDPSVCWRLNAASSRDRSPCLAGGLRRDDRVPGRACRVDELRREGLNPTDTQSPGVDQSRSTPRSASRSSTSR